MILPLERRLRKRSHVDVALLQDEVAEILYGIENNLVLHGGTAVWRCYGGNRFSEDLDFYCPKDKGIEKPFREKLGARSLSILKFKRTDNLIFCKVSDGNTEMRIGVNFAEMPPAPILNPYEKVDGTFMDVLTLSPEDLLLEKAAAYWDRRFIRDLYDVYHLASYVKEEKKVKEEMVRFLGSLQPPVDEKNLKAIVYAGRIPSFSEIAEALRRRFI